MARIIHRVVNGRRVIVLIAVVFVMMWQLTVSAAQQGDGSDIAVPMGAKPESVLPRPRIYDSPRFPVAVEQEAPRPGSRDPRFIYIHQNTQMMYIFENGLIIRQIPTSTGLATPRTITKPWLGRVGVYWGSFFAYDVWADEAWYLFKDDGSILIHSAPYILKDDVKVYQDLELLGKAPASHGCIRIPPEDASWLTAWAPKGVLTLITPLTASLGNG